MHNTYSTKMETNNRKDFFTVLKVNEIVAQAD